MTNNTSSSATRSLRAAVALRDQECPSGGTPASRQINRCKEEEHCLNHILDHSHLQINCCKEKLFRSYPVKFSFSASNYLHPLFRRFLRQRREVALWLWLKKRGIKTIFKIMISTFFIQRNSYISSPECALNLTEK